MANPPEEAQIASFPTNQDESPDHFLLLEPVGVEPPPEATLCTGQVVRQVSQVSQVGAGHLQVLTYSKVGISFFCVNTQNLGIKI